MTFTDIKDMAIKWWGQLQFELEVLKIAFNDKQLPTYDEQFQRAWVLAHKDPLSFVESEALMYWLMLAKPDEHDHQMPDSNVKIAAALCAHFPDEFMESRYGELILGQIVIGNDDRDAGVALTMQLINGLGVDKACEFEKIFKSLTYLSIGDDDGRAYAMLTTLGVNNPEICAQNSEYRKACAQQFESHDRVPPIDLGDETMKSIGDHLARSQNAQHLAGRMSDFVGARGRTAKLISWAEGLVVERSKPQIR